MSRAISGEIGGMGKEGDHFNEVETIQDPGMGQDI